MHNVTSFSNVKADPKVRNIFGLRGSSNAWRNSEAICITESERQWRSAILNSNLPEMSRLLSSFPELVNWKEYITGNTALHFAAKDNDIALLLLLVGSYKADVEARNHGGLTPLHLAAMGGCEEVAFSLLSRFNANSHARDYSGHSPFAYLPATPKGEKMKRFLKDEMESLIAKNPIMEYLKVIKLTELSPVPHPRAHKSNHLSHKSVGSPQPCDTASAPTLASRNCSFRRSRFGQKSLKNSCFSKSSQPSSPTVVKAIKNAHLRHRGDTPYVSTGVCSAPDKEQIEISRTRSFVKQSQSPGSNDLAETIYSTVRRRREQMSYRFNPLTQKSVDDQNPQTICKDELLSKPTPVRGSIFSLDFSPAPAAPSE